MKTILFVMLCFYSLILYGQTGFIEHSISLNLDEGFVDLSGPYSADIDNDGDIDILFSKNITGGLNQVGWLENTDGLGTFIERFSFSISMYPVSIIAADLDNDNDLDIIISGWDDSIVWYENIDGLGNFGSVKIIEESQTFIKTILPVDIDNDNDIDIVVGDFSSSSLILFINELNTNTFTKHIISNVQAVYSIDYGDFDNDNDIDLVCASSFEKKISWYNNINGDGYTWNENIIHLTEFQPRAVNAAYIDNDDLIDVISGVSNSVFWYKNNGNGSFGNPNLIDYQPNSSYHSIVSFDKENDEKIDVFTASFIDDTIAWYRNGDTCCGERQIITEQADEAEIVKSADINLDGRIDIISINSYEGIIFWHENVNYLNIQENHTLNFEVFPNPSDDILYIYSDFAINQIDIYNTLGQLEASFKGIKEIDVSKLKRGLYFLKVTDIDENKGYCKFLKK